MRGVITMYIYSSVCRLGTSRVYVRFTIFDGLRSLLTFVAPTSFHLPPDNGLFRPPAHAQVVVELEYSIVASRKKEPKIPAERAHKSNEPRGHPSCHPSSIACSFPLPWQRSFFPLTGPQWLRTAYDCVCSLFCHAAPEATPTIQQAT